MTIWEIFAELGIGYTLAIVSLGAFMIGFITGCLSVLFVLQKRSIIGDALAHSALPGIGLAFLLVLEKNRTLMLIGALITATLAISLILLISERTKLKEDTAIGIVLSLFFAIGIALMTYIQNLSVSAQAGLEHYIFGNIAFLLLKDLKVILYLSILVLLLIILFWKEYKVILFNKEFAINIGIPVKKLEFLLMFIITLSVVLAIEMIGVVLIAGLLIAPAVAARQWTNKYGTMMLISGLIAGIIGVIGAVTSSKIDDVAPGPVIIVFLTGFVGISLIIGSKNGLLTDWFHRNIFHRKVDHADLLQSFIKSTEGLFNSKAMTLLEFDLNEYPKLTDELLDLMRVCGFCKKLSGSRCALTYKGISETKKLMEEN